MNLNIEGTKHEKAVLVILSYISGFTAGFIVFGVAQLSSTPASTMPAPVVPSVAVQTDTVTTPQADSYQMPGSASTSEVTDQTKNVLYANGRLMANVNGASVLLSAQRDTVDSETAKAFANQGVHQTIPNYSTSSDGAYVYYCEQHTTQDLCTNFMYNVATGIIQYVTIDGQKAITPAAVAKAAFFDGDMFNLNGAKSISTDAPWKLTSAQ